MMEGEAASADRYLGWRRKTLVLAISVLTSFMGFDFVMPFLPIYFRELGVAESFVPLFTGIALGVAPLASAVTSPFWGSLADRYGYKRMLQRVLISFVFSIGAMAFAQDIWQVLVLRVLIGGLGGMTSVAIATAASETPPKHVSEAIGFVQAAGVSSTAIAPAIGGFLSSLVGLRNTFLLAAAMEFGSFLIVTFLYHEVRRDRAAAPSGTKPGAGHTRASITDVLAIPGFALLMAMLLCMQFVDRGMGLITPIYMGLLDVGGWSVPALAGVAFSAGAIASTASSAVAGKLAVRVAPYSILKFTLPATLLICIPFMLLVFGWQLIGMRAALGLFSGASVTLAYSLGSKLLPERWLGTGYGFLSSATQFGGAISLFVTGTIATFELHYVFLLDIVLFFIAFLILRLRLRDRLAAPAPVPASSEAGG